ncbi:MAG: hypothetical protein JSS63_01320 [Bacteroidetes bacterium]|nr:hypothetical protein [Bacteroidota bacterium]
MKVKLFLFILILFAVKTNAQIISDNVQPGLNIARSFNDNSFNPAEFYVYIPDTGAVYFNLHSALGYKVKFNEKSNFWFLPYVEVEKNTFRKTKRDNFKLGALANVNISDAAKNFILDNFLDVRYKRDFVTKKYNTYSFTYYINPYFPSIKNNFVKAIVPGGTRLSIIENVLKYKNNFALGFDYTKRIDDAASNFDQNSSAHLKFDWSIYFLKEKRDLVDLNVSYYFGTKFSYDIYNRKYFNFFRGNITYYFVNDGKNSAGIRYEFVRGDNVVDDIEYDDYQKIVLTFKLVLF